MNAETVRQWIHGAAASIHEQRRYLTQLDAAIGDADHGTNMDRGFSALVDSRDIAQSSQPGQSLITAGGMLAAGIGGASGALWGTALQRAGDALGDARELQCAQLADALEMALDGIVGLGAADEGDKTMVDALAPASRALRRQAKAGATMSDALTASREAGEAGMRATIALRASKGRASYLGERSVGYQDPGATSTVLILAALEQAVARG